MTRRALLVASAFALAGAAGCGRFIDGSGVAATETRELGDVTEIVLAGGGTLVVVPGETNRVIVSADDNVLPLVETRTSGNRLTLTMKNGYAVREQVPVTYTVFVARLDKLTVSGSGNASGEGLTGGELAVKVSGSGNVTLKALDHAALDVTISGSGNVTLAGAANKLTAKISGSGKVDAADLRAAAADVGVSGSGGLTVWAADDLKARVSGSGDVRYRGRPRVEQKVSGSGSVKPLE